MLTSNRSDFHPYPRRASVTISNRRVRTRTHGGVAGVGGQPPPLCRSNGVLGSWDLQRRASLGHSVLVDLNSVTALAGQMDVNRTGVEALLHQRFAAV